MAHTLKRSWRRAVLISLVGVGTLAVVAAGSPSAWAGGALKITLVRTEGNYGDSTFIVMPNGRTALVDGGNDFESINQLTAYLDTAVGVGGTIWYMALSHAHGDHMSGLESAMNRYVVMRYYSSFPENDPDAESISTTGYSYFTALLNTEFSAPYTTNINCYEILATASPTTTPKVSGSSGVNLGPGWDTAVDAMVISGEEMSSNTGPNSNSVGYHIWYGSSTVLSAGDTTGTGSFEGDMEAAMVTNYGGAGGRIYQNVQLVKLSHHGGPNSNSTDWFNAIQPADPLKRYAYVCTGAPTASSNFSGAMQTRLIAQERVLYRTDLDGNARYATLGDGSFSTVRQYVYPEGGTTSTSHPNLYGPPDPPGSPAASQAGVDVNLSWSAPTTPGGTTLQYYFIYRSTVPVGGGVAIPFVAGEDPSAANWRSGSVPGVYQRIARILAPGTTYQDAVGASPPLYHYRIRAVHNYYYESEFSVEFTTDIAAPGIPVGLALPGGGSDAAGAYLNLTWTANTETDIWDYRIWRATYSPVGIGGAFSPATAILAPGTTHRDPGLGNGTTSYYRLTARDPSGNESGGSSEVSGNFRDSTAPAAPTGLGLADAPADQGNVLNLSWAANTEADLKDYRVRRTTFAGVGAADPVVATLLPPGTTHQDGGLTAGATYYYRLSARDGVLNESGLSTEASAYPVDNLAPVTPSGLGLADPGTTVLNLSWMVNTEGDLKDYRVYRSTNAGVTIVSSHVVAAVNAPGTTHQDGGLTAGSRYNYRIAARDASLNESGGSAETFGIPGPPAAPAGLAISSVVATGQRLNLTWTANTDGDLKEYRVRRTTFVGVGLADPVVATVAAGGTTHQDGGLGNGATYYYRLAARDTSLNESGLSSELSGVPQDSTPPAAPSGLGAANPGLGLRLNLTWTANSEADLKDYRIRRTTFVGVGTADPVVATALAPGTTHQDAGLANGTTYYYRLSARDASLNESGLSVVDSSGTPSDTPPGAPTGLGAADVPDDLGGALRLSWAANAEGDLKDYGVYRATFVGAGLQAGPVVRVAQPGTTHQDSGLSNGATYYYRLSARDTVLNESDLSAEASASPFSNAVALPESQPPPPPPPTVSVSVTIAAAAGGSANLQTALEPGKDTTISGNVLTLASSGVAAGNTIEVKIVNTVATAAPGAGGPAPWPARHPALAFELPRINTVVGPSGEWSLKTPVLADGSYQIQLRQVQGSLASGWVPDPPFSVNVDAVPDALAVVPAGPNPFRPGAGVSLALGFELAEAAQVSVTIHAEDGALVATLMDGQTLSAGRYTRSPAGSSAMVWDGRSDAGKSAASGVYFCRITIGDRQFTRKILLIR